MQTIIEFKGATQEEIAELQQIAKDHGGQLNPPDLVAFARDPKAALHSEFEWDDKKAGHEHRLWQAREIIRAIVQVIDIDGRDRDVRAFISLKGDRGEGGYRAIVDVLSETNLREQLLIEAKADMVRFRSKYGCLKELADVFEAMDGTL